MNEQAASPGEASLSLSFFSSKSPESGGSLRRQESPEIEINPTFDSDASTHDDLSCHSVEEEKYEQKLGRVLEIPGIDTAETTNSCEHDQKYYSEYEEHLTFLYIAAFSFFGYVLRMYMARFFGLDCEQKGGPDAVNDFLSPLSEMICITATGTTEQTGGALFVDLPANMLGCMLLGLLCPEGTGQPLAWFRADHPLQQHTAFHTALKVAFCGSLTTFASWNTQMVIMMDGTFTELGPQVPAALFGYFIGFFCCLGSFSFGRIVYDWLRARHATPEPNSAVDEEIGEGPLPNDRCEIAACIWNVRFGSLAISVFLTAAFIVGDAIEGITFYRQMWMSLILAPLGALLRWKLSEFNTDSFPRGTLVANITAACLYALVKVLTLRYAGDDLGTWTGKLLSTLEIAFCGSLSTVSTLIKEITDAPIPAKGYLYGLTTIFSAMFLGLAIYSPIARW